MRVCTTICSAPSASPCGVRTATRRWRGLRGLLYAGVDPRLIMRRVMAHASEDVGMANPIAMLQAAAAAQDLEFMGMPEARLPMAQAIIAVCESPKSNSV